MSAGIDVSNLLFKLIAIGAAIIIVLVAFWLLGKFFKRYKNPTDPMLKSKSTVMLIAYSIIRFVIVAILILFILSVFGVNVSGAIAGLGIAGAAAVLAVQDLVKDFIMGVTIISDEFFKVGDVVQYNDFIGKVTSLTMRSVKIKSSLDGSVLSVQNHKMSEVRVLSHLVNIPIPLPYDLPQDQALEVLEKACERCRALEEVEQILNKGANTLNDSSISYLIMLYCDPMNYLSTRRAVLYIILDELAKNGIQIPFPQLDVHAK